MPGSETNLEELTSRVLGHLVQEGVVAKLAKGLYCGGFTPNELLNNLARTLEALKKDGLNLSASKTMINYDSSDTFLGWVWHEGTLQASLHRIAALTKYSPPPTVTNFRSFIGAFKLGTEPCVTTFLSPLDAV